MVYLISYVWKSTKDNHTGMSYMCDLLVQMYPKRFRVYKHYQHDRIRLFHINRVNNLLNKIIEKFEDIRILFTLYVLLFKLDDGDTILLTEYLHPNVNHLRLAKLIKKKRPKIRVYGMAHLTPTMLKNMNISSVQMEIWNKNVDYFVTLGSNLTMYINSFGIPQEKIITTRHYVDAQYYNSLIDHNGMFQVIVIGNMQRNYNQLEEIIKLCSTIKFIICAGKENLSQLKKYSNVKVLGYISENELKDYMAQSSISMSVMEDTVGSNVVVTSMAMGLCQVVSDVGAIRDYCTDENAMFCSSTKDFVNSLQYLNNHSEELYQKRINAKLSVKEFSIERFINDLSL